MAACFFPASPQAKLASLLNDKPRLTDENEAELERIRRLLCLPTDAVRKASRETAGKILEEAIRCVPACCTGPQPMAVALSWYPQLPPPSC